mmetsp:Transcript_46202/g.100602  ORF Transcript_46202/g.100602 Transcript_46202/m.100602 type:complete len:361 (-) Transcript_46202:119-1201(-)
MSGGSKEPDGDGQLTKNLARMFEVPEPQVASFMQTRERKTLGKLQTLLQTMPATEWSWGGTSMPTTPSAAKEDAASPASAMASPTSASPTSHRDLDLGSLNPLRTSYSNFFNDGQSKGEVLQRPKAAPVHAFGDLIKESYRPHFDAWRSTADDEDLDALADTCRSLRSLDDQTRPKTTYFGLCGDRGSSTGSTPQCRWTGINHRNRSSVPMGSIKQERSRGLPRRRLETDLARSMDEASVRAQEYRCGTAPAAHHKSLRIDSTPHPALQLSAHACFETSTAHPGNTRSVGQATWHPGVHGKGNPQKYGFQTVRPGERAWQASGCDVAFEMGLHSWPRKQPGMLQNRSQSMPAEAFQPTMQ